MDTVNGNGNRIESPDARPSSVPAISTIFLAGTSDGTTTCFPADEGAMPSSNGTKSHHHQHKVVERTLVPTTSSPSPSHQRQSEANLHRRTQFASPQSPPGTRNSQNVIVVPPAGQRVGYQSGHVPTAQQPEQGAKRHSTQSAGAASGEGMLVQLQQKLFEHYYMVAYALVIITYFLAFCEYLYLRLVSLIFPETITYRRLCEKHFNETVYRNELHFASGWAVFLVMSIYQLVCFFLLTVSSKYLEVKRTFNHVISIEERLHHELVFAVKRTMFATLYPTFGIYLLSSSVIFCAIFYMVGLRDPIVHVGSRVIVYLFDVSVVLYFLAFPLLCVLFHPDINCRVRFAHLCCTARPRRPREGKAKTISQSFCQTSGNAEAFSADAAHNQAASGRSGGAGVVHSSAIVTTHPTRICPATNAANYGSLERRKPAPMVAKLPRAEDTQISPDGSNESVATENQTEAVRRRMRQRRQSRYKRLRGSDESAEFRMGVEGLEAGMGNCGELDGTRSEGSTDEEESAGSDVEQKQRHPTIPNAQFRGFKQVAIEQRNEEDGDGSVHC